MRQFGGNILYFNSCFILCFFQLSPEPIFDIRNVFTSLIVLATCVATATAHATVYSIWLNGVDQGDGRNGYVRFQVLFDRRTAEQFSEKIRSPPTNDPVKDLKSSAMACNVNNRGMQSRITNNMLFNLDKNNQSCPGLFL